MVNRKCRLRLALITASAALIVLTFTAQPVYAAPALTLAVSPAVISNGGIVTLSGTAPCARVVINGSPGASGVAYAHTTATVEHGRFLTRYHLSRFERDPSRPGLFSGLAFYAFCPGSKIPEATAGIQLTGVELAATGSSVEIPLAVSLFALVLGAAGVMAGSRRRRAFL